MLYLYKSFIFSLLLLTCTAFLQAMPSDQLEYKLLRLHLELDEVRKEAFNNEMQAQPLMFDNWMEYREDIEKHQKNEKRINEIKQKIQDLQDQRDVQSSFKNNPVKV